ncbi:MAG: hypothetical protein AAF399_11915 [Bacteroidota bacterium]
MVFTAIILGTLSGIILTLILLIWLLPKKVQYVESIQISAPISTVYDAIRFQERLMEWSAWPTETNSLCEVQHQDGEIGAHTIYMNKKGKKFGYQEITHLIENEKVGFLLKSFVAPFEEDVRLEFILRSISAKETEVKLWFDETLKKPAFLIAYVGGILKWVRNMHFKDLQGLKKYAESANP